MEKRSTLIVQEDANITSAFSRVPYYPLVVEKGRGAIIEDVDGKQYIDLLASAAALNTGHTHPKVVAAIVNQVHQFIHYTSAYIYSDHQVQLGKALASIMPGKQEYRVAFGLSGSDAIDGMMKVARAYTGRSKMISFIQAYHGSTYGALSLSALSLNMRRKVGPLVPDIYHIPYPDCYRCPYDKEESTCSLQCLNPLKTAFAHFLPPEEVAAMVIEPIAGDAGLIVPPKSYMQALYELCKSYGILFVTDEVQQGFGRTGRWFGIEHLDIVPDIVVMGKAIASGMPLSAIVGRKDIMEALSPPAHLFTTAANPVSCQAALATIEVIKEENLVEHSRELGKYVLERFRKMKEKYELIGDVRGQGLSIGVDLVTDRVSKQKANEAAAKICYRCYEKGVIVIFLAQSVLRIQPPLVITKEEMDQALDIIETSIQEYLNGEIPDEVLEVAKGW